MYIRKIALATAGFVLLGLGIVGIALPVMPTTPFVIASAVCLTGSSPKLAGWLEKNKFFGCYIQNYREKTGVYMKTKIVSVILLWAGLIVSMVLSQNKILFIILPIVGVCVTAHILLLKTREKD